MRAPAVAAVAHVETTATALTASFMAVTAALAVFREGVEAEVAREDIARPTRRLAAQGGQGAPATS